MQYSTIVFSITISICTFFIFIYSFRYYKKYSELYKLPFNNSINLKDKETIAIFIVFFIPYINLCMLAATLVVGLCFGIVSLTNIISHYICKNI